MTTLETYLIAVAKRKSISRKMSGTSVNHAVVLQLEEHDIPLLLEIIRIQNAALEQVLHEMAGEPAEDIVCGPLRRSRIKVEDLAASGNCSKWGEASDDGNRAV
jgi:hypothetical protein